MDSHQFDTLTRRFVTRRAGAGLALAAAFGLAAPAADARKRRNNKRKKCKPACGPCQTCTKGKCQPIAGQKPCGATCIASNTCCTDGAPGCENGFACVGGACVYCIGAACASDTQCCTGLCIANTCRCGRPNQACVSNAQCCAGTCNLAIGTCARLPAGGLCQSSSECSSGVCSLGQCL